MNDKLVIMDEREGNDCYAAYLEGARIGWVGAVEVTDTILIPHIEIEPGKHDLGIGSLLVRRVFDDARAEGHSVLALCPYAHRWIQLHPSYGDVSREPKAGERIALAALVTAVRGWRQLTSDDSAFDEPPRPNDS